MESGPKGSVPTLAPPSAEQAADEAADHEAIASEPLLPAAGTAERERLDGGQAAMVAGLLAGFRPSSGRDDEQAAAAS
jgi:hypothetical protein